MDMLEPRGLITRMHFYGYRPHPDPAMPPPHHVVSINSESNWYPAPRPQTARFAQPGPALVYGGAGLPSLGVDPTDPATWAGRGYRECAGMVGRLNTVNAWQGNPEQLNPLGMGQ